MTSSPRRFWYWLHTPYGTKWFRYSLVSVVAVLVSQAVLLLTYGVLRLWSAVVSNVVATAVATIPSYYLNRKWVWGKGGRSHLMKEVLPFWALAFLGLAISIWSVDLAERWTKSVTNSHPAAVVAVMAASLAAFGVVWVVKFMIFNRLMFVDRSERSTGPATAPASAQDLSRAAAVESVPPEPSIEPAATGREARPQGHADPGRDGRRAPGPEGREVPGQQVGDADGGLAVAADAGR